MVVASNRDIQEVDISALLAYDNWSWIEEDVSPNVLHDDALKFGYCMQQLSYLTFSGQWITFLLTSFACNSPFNNHALKMKVRIATNPYMECETFVKVSANHCTDH